MQQTQSTQAGERTRVGVPITWTGDARRIASLFCKYDPRKLIVSVHTPMGEITSKVNPSVMDVCGYVGMHLAGKPLGQTEEILKGLKLWK